MSPAVFAEYLEASGAERVPGADAPPWVIAHRGYSGVAPENTLAAVDAARALGVDLIEVDINLSADGTPIVIHDQTLSRTTGSHGTIAQLSDERISLADAGGWLGPGYAGQRVSPLRTVLAALRAHGGSLLLELKHDWSPGAVSRVAEEIIAAGMSDRTIVQSFSARTVGACRDLAPMVPRCLLRMVPKEGDLELAAELEAIGINVSMRGYGLRRELVEEAMRAGFGVFVFTVDTAREWERLLAGRVHGLITNQPGRLQGYLAAKYEAV